MVRRTRLDEDDLKSILGDAMRGTWFDEGAEIVAIEFRTRSLKRGGDYYRDVAGPDDRDVEVVKSVVVVTRSRKNDSDDGRGVAGEEGEGEEVE